MFYCSQRRQSEVYSNSSDSIFQERIQGGIRFTVNRTKHRGHTFKKIIISNITYIYIMLEKQKSCLVGFPFFQHLLKRNL